MWRLGLFVSGRGEGPRMDMRWGDRGGAGSVVTGEFFVEYMFPQLKHAWERASEIVPRWNVCEIAQLGNMPAGKHQDMRAFGPWYLHGGRRELTPVYCALVFQPKSTKLGVLVGVGCLHADGCLCRDWMAMAASVPSRLE